MTLKDRFTRGGSGRQTTDLDEIEFVPQCGEYRLDDAEDADRRINREWWDEEGCFKLHTAIENSTINRKEVAEIVNLSDSAVSQHLHGRRPSMDVYREYIRLFGEDLFDDPQFDVTFEGARRVE